MLIKKLIENKLSNTLNNDFVFIIGLTPSRGARSPKLWNKVYKKKKFKIRMIPADVKRKNLNKLIKHLKKNQNFLGGSVTAPYKVEIMKYLDGFDIISKKIGSINTILKIKNKLHGYNTDYFGALNTLKNFTKKKRILIFGCGGAGRSTILAIINKFKHAKFYFYNRNKNKLKKYLSILGNSKNINILNDLSEIYSKKNFDLIVNTTSIGFDSWIKKKNYFYNLKAFSPLTNLKKIAGVKNKNYEKFIKKNSTLIKHDTENLINFFKVNKKSDIFDIIYFPKKTKLLKYGHKKCKNGLKMNLDQAVKAFQIVNKNKNYKEINSIMSQNG